MTMQEALRDCQSNPLFDHLSMDQLQVWLRPESILYKDIQAQEWIHHQGDICHFFELILDGEVVIEKLSASGQVQLITRLKAPQTLGDSLLFSPDPRYPMDVRATKKTRILRLSAPLLLDLGQADRLFLEKFLSSVTEKAAILSRRIASLSMQSIRQTIWLDLKHWQKEGQETITIPFSKKEWAANIGCQRTSLSRELQKMQEEGLLSYSGRTFSLLESSWS